MSKIPLRGDIWYVDLDPTRGHEQAKKRPCLVISADTYNKGKTELAVVLPITSRYRPLSWLVEIHPPESGLNKVSYVICNQIRTVSLDRFDEIPIGKISENTFPKIEQRLKMLLYLD